MSSEKRTAANRTNATKSTGPRTRAGKATAARNALAHGLCSAAPILPGELATDWDAHRAGVLAALDPAGGLEDALAERAAVCLWRLRRVVAYETAVTAAGVEDALDAAADRDNRTPGFGAPADRLEDAELALDSARSDARLWADVAALFEHLPGLPDDAPVSGEAVEGLVSDLNGALPTGDEECFDTEDREFLTSLGVPTRYHASPFEWGGWTAGLVRQVAAAVAAEFGIDAGELFARAAVNRRESQEGLDRRVAELEAESAILRRRVEGRTTRAVVRRGLPDADMLDKVCRYEAHLSRQLLQALHTLERIQATRAGKDVPPPAAGTLVVDQPLSLPDMTGG